MEEEQLIALQSKNPEKIKSILRKFNEANSALFDFTNFNTTGQWIAIWKTIFGHLQDPEMESAYPICLNTIRILTRDDYSIQNHNITDDFNCLLKLAFLGPGDDLVAGTINYNNTKETIIEALKCLCNLVFQGAECRRLCIKNSCCDNILRRICSTTDQEHSYDIDFYDLKLLFLVTATEPESRSRVQIELSGQVYLTHLLDEKLKDNVVRSDAQVDLLCEILKVLFNITTDSDESLNEKEIQNRHLTSVVRGIFFEFGAMENERELNVITHAINLLNNVSSACLSELLLKCEADLQSSDREKVEFEGWNVRAVDVLLRYIKEVLNHEEGASSRNDSIPPILTVLVKCVRCNRTLRHYIRNEILPPLKDVSHRPEVGNELRNHLCRFLTRPEILIRDLTAELLFVCCKENVGRMIKYTGYGNAAGLFASRGLLDCRVVEHTEYSSDSEDSDTEEYKKVQHGVNPVLGCFEAPKRSPFEGMSEEQKEYEAMQLVELMDKLHRTGIVQPCRIDEAGTPQPVEHILQLQEELPQQQLESKHKS